MGLIDLLRGNASLADIEHVQKELAPILIDGEQVEIAFKLVRDQIVFTNRRMLFVNKQGVTGKRTDWMTIPYRNIVRFSAESAGWTDMEAELRIWVGHDTEPIKLEISRSVSIKALYQALSHYVLEQ